jgi:putative endopeptidase
MALLVAVSLFSGCSNAADTPDTASTDGIDGAAALVSGIDTEGMNTAVRPQDDFYEYANGTWLASTEIPADEIGWGSYMTLSKQSLQQSRAILDELLESSESGSDAEKLSDFYRAWMDDKRVAELGATPLTEDLAAIAALKDHKEVATLLGKMNPEGLDGPFNFFVDQDAKDSTTYIVEFNQSGLGLPDRDYYFDDSERGQMILDAYRVYLETLMGLAGIEDSAAAVERTIALETALAEQQWDKVKDPGQRADL